MDKLKMLLKLKINGLTFGIRSDRKREFGERSKRQIQRRKISRLQVSNRNLGLRYVTVECNHADSEKNYE